MKILVLGAGGLVGSALDQLPDTVGLERQTLDITDFDAVKRAVDVHRPNAIINAAAQAGVDHADQYPEDT